MFLSLFVLWFFGTMCLVMATPIEVQFGPPLTSSTTSQPSPPITDPNRPPLTTTTEATPETTTTTTIRPTTTPPIHFEDPDWILPIGPLEEHSSDFWMNIGQQTLEKQLNKNKLNTNRAKNIILIVGDGLSIPTQMATRMYLGGEELELSFEKFPYTGLSKTYCVNHQVADSACTATALLTGIKNNYGVLGFSASVPRSNCTAEQMELDKDLPTLMKLAQDFGKRTGIVTNTRVTHATPAAAYARTADRYWEADAPTGCQDIADQLVNGEVGREINVILGGGRREFLPRNSGGRRNDGRHLIHEWLSDRRLRGNAAYVQTQDNLLNTNNNVSYLMGLFDESHMDYNLFREPNIPSFTEMSMKALNVLQTNNENGYFLFIESGRIDHAHHSTKARLALDETVEFHHMIEEMIQHINLEDTLIVVTADHSHTMSIGGYPRRGNDILAMGDFSNEDNLPFYTLSYANGLGHFDHFYETGGRVNPIGIRSYEPDFKFPATVPLDYETHGGDDVGVFADGPWAHLFTGTYEQNYIAHVIMYASCLGDGLKADICH